MRILSDDDVADLLELDELLDVVADAFVAQGAGRVERPDRPHFPVGVGLDDPDTPGEAADEALGTGLVMPAYVHGARTYATKLADVHPGNVARDLPTVQATVAVSDAQTGEPLAYLAGTRITNARTGCIGGVAARELAVKPVRLGVLGAGQQARWQTRAIATACDVAAVRVYSPSDSRHDCADDLAAVAPTVRAVDSPREAVRESNVVVTATTSTEPVFDGDDIAPGTLVVAVGAYTAELRELDERTVERATQLFADVPEEVCEVGEMRAAGVTADDLTPLSAVVAGDAGRASEDEILLVESVGTAVLDAATADHLYDRAIDRGVGTTVEL